MRDQGYLREQGVNAHGFSRPITPGGQSVFSGSSSRPFTPGTIQTILDKYRYDSPQGNRPQTAGLDEQRPSPSADRHSASRPATAGELSPYSDWSILEQSSKRSLEFIGGGRRH